MKIEISERDAGIIFQALDSYLSDLRLEIAHTERKEFREDLKIRERTLTKFIEQLKETMEEPEIAEPTSRTRH